MCRDAPDWRGLHDERSFECGARCWRRDQRRYLLAFANHGECRSHKKTTLPRPLQRRALKACWPGQRCERKEKRKIITNHTLLRASCMMGCTRKSQQTVPRARRALQTFSLGETLIRTMFVSKMTVFGLTEASRVRCSMIFLQIFLKEVAAREQFSAVSLLYTAQLPQRVIFKIFPSHVNLAD